MHIIYNDVRKVKLKSGGILIKKWKYVYGVLIAAIVLNPAAKMQTNAYMATDPSTNDYTQWKQTSVSWGEATPWPNASVPKFGDAGCWITSMAMILREYHVVNDSDMNSFNPIICNSQLMTYGVVNSAGDYDQLENIALAYDGITYAGCCSYSFSQLKELFDQGYACIIQEDGHYVAVQDVTSEGVIVMDPGYDRNYPVDPIGIQFYKIEGAEIHNLTGCIWEAFAKDDDMVLSGWAFDKENPDQCVDVKIYVGNLDTENMLCYTVKADIVKKATDSQVPYLISMGNCHRYDTVIPVFGMNGNQTIRIYAENPKETEEKRLLGIRTIRFSCGMHLDDWMLKSVFEKKDQKENHSFQFAGKKR